MVSFPCTGIEIHLAQELPFSYQHDSSGNENANIGNLIKLLAQFLNGFYLLLVPRKTHIYTHV